MRNLLILATIVRSNKLLNQTPNQVYVKLIVLNDDDIDDIIHTYFAIKLNPLQTGYVHYCPMATVSGHEIAYVAMEHSMLNSVQQNNFKAFSFTNLTNKIFIDYVNKDYQADVPIEAHKQLKGFQIGLRIQSHQCFYTYFGIILKN